MLRIFLILIPFLTEILADFDLNILPAGSSHSRGLNSSIVFSCEVEESDEADGIDIKWIGPGETGISEKPINSGLNDMRKYVEEDNGHVKKLYIKNIELGDAGNYTCVATATGQQQRKSVGFIVFKEIVFESAKSPQHPAIHTEALIVCKVDGLPKPEVSWRFKDRKLDAAGGRYTKVKDGLMIKNITMEDDGTYQCSANVENDGRFDFRNIKVEVHVPPTMLEGPGTIEGVEDDEATISCKGEGFPDPEYNFFKDGKLVEGDERVVADKVAGELNFKPLKEEDAGEYRCIAYNDVGKVDSHGSLNVLVRPQITEFANKSQNEGQPISMECKARGIPTPKFEFTKEGREHPFELGDSSEEDARVSVISNGEGVMRLTIKKLIPSDAGSYRCTATNDVGVGEVVANLEVTYKPKFAPNHTTDFYIWAQKTRNISCEVDAQPPATIKWFRDGDLVKENSTYKLFESDSKSLLQITVRDVDQYWIYGALTCNASNGYGESHIDVQLVRATNPDRPKLVEVLQNLPNGFILRVIPPEDDGGEPLSGYHVEYYEKNSTEVIEDYDDDDNPAYQHKVAIVKQLDDHFLKVDDLRPSTNYILKVKAKNEVGLGDYVKVESKTEDIRKPYPVKIKSKSFGDAHHYTIQWQKPETGGAPIEEYEFKYRLKKVVDGQETFDEWTTFFRKDNEDHPFESFHLKNLEPNSTYQFQVRAKNKIDWSDYSPLKEFQTSEAVESEHSTHSQGGMSGGLVVGLVLFVLILVLMIVDLVCYAGCRKGVTHALVTRSRERSRTGEKEKVMEEGEKQNIEPGDIQNDNPINADEDLLKTHDDDDIKKPPIIEESIEDELDFKKDVA